MTDTATKTPTIALAGNPNCGKTTLFNGLTGSNQRIGNWPGVTVERKEGSFRRDGSPVRVVDLPGIYSLSADSDDERVSRDYLLGGEPDLVVNILDSTNLERNLYLTTQLLEMQVPLLVILNMADMARNMNIVVDRERLEKRLGCPVVEMCAVKDTDVRKARDAIAAALREPGVSPVQVEYPDEVERVVAAWSPRLAQVARRIGASPRWTALKILERDSWIGDRTAAEGALTEEEIRDGIASVETSLQDDCDVILADHRYGFIHEATKGTVRKKPDRIPVTDRIDRVVMHRFLGVPVFLAVMYFVFWVTINFGGAFIDFFDILTETILVDGFGTLLGTVGAPPWIVALLAGGIGGGIQTVATFIPIIFMMFFMLSLLEDSGYMARAAFVMDRFMQYMGLPGKAFMPMLVGFGCTVPAIMATRTLESRKDRFMTVFMVPFMSCGARLPVYALFAAAFFPTASGFVVFSLYAFGIVLAVLTGLLLKSTLFRGEPTPFVMELPPYHLPRMRYIFSYTWRRLKAFLRRAGKVIVLMVAVLSFLNAIGTDGSLGNEDTESSLLAGIGKTITPVFEPMGIERDNWPATVALFTGIFAKEAVVGTLNGLYGQINASRQMSEEKAGGASSAGSETAFDPVAGIVEAFRTIPAGLAALAGSALDPLGLGLLSETEDETAIAEEVGADAGVFTALRGAFAHGKPQAYAYLLFVLIYFPCVAAFAAAARELGSAWAWLSAAYLTVLAWCTATLAFQLFVGHDPLWIAVPILLLGGLILAYRIIGERTNIEIGRKRA